MQHGREYVGLSQWLGQGLEFQIEQHNRQVRKVLRERLISMKAAEFEELISQLLPEMGFEMVEVTKYDALANSICHVGRVLSGIHDFNRLQDWIPAKSLPE